MTAVAATASLRLLLEPLLDGHLPYGLFILAVAVAGWAGGMWPSLAAILCSVIVADYLFTVPDRSLAVAGPPKVVGVVRFLVAGGIVAVLAEVVHRTMRKSTETATALLEREQAARIRAEAATERLAFLVQASANLTISLEPRAVLSSTLDLSKRLVAADAYAIWRLDSKSREWSIVASEGLSERYQQTTLEVMGNTPQMPDETLVAEDVSQLPILAERQQSYQDEGIRSMLIAPLRIHGQVCGTLVLYYRSPRRFTDVEVTTATALANLAASAIGSADLYDQERQSQSERLRLIQKLEEADQRKDDFLAMLAHELRNPLAAIRYAIEVARATPSANGEVTEIIDHQTRQLAHLIDDLLDVSRITRGKIQLRRQAVDAAEIADRAVKAVRPLLDARRHEISVEVATEPMPLFGDPTRLEQILVNLLTNAAKYTPEGGHVWLTAAPENGQTIFSIRDDGLGIPEPLLPQIFELFHQVDRSLDRAQGGLGLGLTLVRSLVEMHGGEILAKSDGPGRGSEFVVRLPRSEQNAASAPPAPIKGPHAAEGVRILLVEDSDPAAFMLRTLLEGNGHTVEVATDGLKAVELAPFFRPDVVLLDIGLPGLDGYHVAQRLREDRATQDVTIIGVSGYGQERDRAHSRAAGFDHHLVKPVEFSQLVPLLRAKSVS